MPNPSDSPKRGQDDPGRGFNVESFLSDIAKVSELEAKFFIHTHAIKYDGGAFSKEQVDTLVAIEKEEIFKLLSPKNKLSQIKINNNDPRRSEDGIAIRIETIEHSNRGARYVVPVRIERSADGQLICQREVFSKGKAAYLSFIKVESENEDSMSITRSRGPQLDQAAFAEATEHLRASFEQPHNSVPSFFRLLSDFIAKALSEQYVKANIAETKNISGQELEDAYKIEAVMLSKKHNIPEILHGQVVAEHYGETRPSAIVQMEVAFATSQVTGLYETRLIASVSTEITLDPIGKPAIRNLDIRDIRHEFM